MLEKGIIRPIVSEWASPVVLVKKRDGTMRFCVDYRALNAITKGEKFPLSLLDDLLLVLGGNNTFSILDAASAYWQIPMAPDSQEKTTFTCHSGTFAFNVMPFGLKNASAIFLRVVVDAFKEFIHKFLEVYLDDWTVFGLV